MSVNTLVQLRSATPSLTTRLWSGGVWLGSANILEQVLRFARNIVLARLLVPEAFGTMAIVLSIASAVETFTEVGVREAIVQNPRGREGSLMNSAFWIAFSRTLCLYLFLFLTAPLVGRFYTNSQLVPLIRVAALSLLFTGLTSPGAYIAMKDMRFKRWAAIMHGGGMGGVLVTILLAMLTHDVWALALGYVAENAFRCSLSHLICPFVPTLKIDRDGARQLWAFSKRAIGLPFFNFIFIRSDVFVIGKVFSASTLGLYSLAISLAQVPAGFVMNLLGQLLMPTFSEVQQNNRKVNDLLLQVTSLLACLGLPIVAFVALSAHDLLAILYGSNYAAMAPALLVTAFTVLLNVLNGQITTVFYARGLPNLHRRCVVIMAILMAILIYPSIRLVGIVGAPIAALVAVAVGYMFQIARVKDLTGLRYSEYLKSFVPGFILVFCVIAIRLVCLQFVRPNTIGMSMLPGVAGCVVAYGALLLTPLRRGITVSIAAD